MTLDLGPATAALATLVRGVRDDQLDGPTPCPAYTVADLLDHIGGFPVAFTAAARKEQLEGGADPSGDGSRLEEGFRERIAASLDELAEAWHDPAAYDGMTQAGPVELPGEVAAMVALNETVVHGWDLARATGQAYDPDPVAVGTCLDFAFGFSVEGEGPFGPPVPVPDEAPALDRLAGATGRDPRWTS